MKKRTARKRGGRTYRAQKTAAVHARVRPENRAKLIAMAKRAGMSPSAFVDRMIEVHSRIEVEAQAVAALERSAAPLKAAA